MKDDEVKAMVAECNGPLNFPNFLDLFSAKLNGKSFVPTLCLPLILCPAANPLSFPPAGSDPEEMLLNAFKLFDMQNTGSITKDE